MLNCPPKATCYYITSCAARWPPQYVPAPADRRPISGQFVIRGQELPMCVPNLKIVAFSVCEILRGSQNFEIGSRTPGHAYLGANLRPGGKNCPRSMCMPNLKIVAFSVCEILRGSQNFEIGSRTPDHAHLGPICGPRARTAHGLCAYQI